MFYWFQKQLLLHGHSSFVRFMCVPLCSSVVHLGLFLKQWRAVHVQHCNKSMPRFSQLFPQKYCQDICNASCYLLSPVTAAFPASYWSPFKREHFGCRGVCISVCTTCGCLLLCLHGSLSDRASKECFECISLHGIHSW